MNLMRQKPTAELNYEVITHLHAININYASFNAASMRLTHYSITKIKKTFALLLTVH